MNRDELEEAYFRDLQRGCGWMLFFVCGTVVVVFAIITMWR